MDKESNEQRIIDLTITAIKEAEAEGSVTNVQVASVLQFLNEILKEVHSDVSDLKVSSPLIEEKVKTLAAGGSGRDLFNKMWDVLWGQYGRYDPKGAPDAEHPYYGNEIWMSLEEAIYVLQFGITKYPNPGSIGEKCRTNLYIQNGRTFIGTYYGVDLSQFLLGASIIETVRLAPDNDTVQADKLGSGALHSFRNKPRLKKILGIIWVSSVKEDIDFYGLSSLTEVRLSQIKRNWYVGHSPLLSYDSLKYAVDNANPNISVITITVHADVYAKLTGDTTNEAAASLSVGELQQWQQLLVDAAAKNISFAKP